MIAIQYSDASPAVLRQPRRPTIRGGGVVLPAGHSRYELLVKSSEDFADDRGPAEVVDANETAQGLWQPSLFAQGQPSPDAGFSGLTRHRLDDTAWVDHVAGWLGGADGLFEELMTSAPWESTTQELYGKIVVTPRLVARWPAPADLAQLPPVIARMRDLLGERYEREFDSVGANLYRDGRDSVAWHGDHIPRRIVDPIVATVSLGHPRRFLMRPRQGRTELSLALGMGDLVVMGGSSQRTWLHAVPKVANAGPRISVAYRHST
jgi:alkylated DNA repair dioxygenase AlkB